MLFKIILEGEKPQILPINYQYPLSAALYSIMNKGNAEYASFLHEKGYGKGFKFFTFSQIHCPFTITGNRIEVVSHFDTFSVDEMAKVIKRIVKLKDSSQ